MKRFVTAVFQHDTNNFSPIPTPLASFGRFAGERGPVYAEDALEAYRAPVFRSAPLQTRRRSEAGRAERKFAL